MATPAFSVLCVIPFCDIFKFRQTKPMPNERRVGPVLTPGQREWHGGIQSGGISAADLGRVGVPWPGTDPPDFD